MIEVNITDEMRVLAAQKSEKLGELKNSITRGRGNMTGYLGELAVVYAMGGELKNTRDYDILFDGNIKADVKSKSCAVAPQDHFDCSISDYNTKQNCDRYIFVRVSKDHTKAWIVGWYPKEEYYKESVFIQQGQLDRSNNWRAKCDCWNMPISALKKIEDFKLSGNDTEQL